MAEPLKNIYNRKFFAGFTKALKQVYPEFNKDLFCSTIMENDWETLELKQRMRRISTTLKDFLPSGYKNAIQILLDLTDQLKENQSGLSFEYMFIPDFVEQYGLEDYHTSISAMEKITQFASCEFAVRPFIIKYPEKLMAQMQRWSKHKHHAVRRFSSEGCRPRLPWAMALPGLKENPEPILPILENLKNDTSDFVRKSVANNLNDIAKDHPDMVIALAKEWKGKSKQTDWIIKHGSRTLLKQGNTEALSLFGFGSAENIHLVDFRLAKPAIRTGQDLLFEFVLVNRNKQATKIRLEYAIYYQKANGTLSKKVYSISEKEYLPNSETRIGRKQSFRPISTRKFHPGLHQLAIIVNGKEFEKYDFELVA